MSITTPADNPINVPAASMANTPRPFTSTFHLAFWMALILAACKIVHFHPPASLTWAQIQWYFSSVTVSIHQDILYALVIGLLGQAALSLTRRRPRLQTALWLAIAFLCLISAFYAVISVQVFWFLRMPLTYPLIYLAGDVKNMQSSVGAFMTPLVAASLIGVPLLYLVLIWFTRRLSFPRMPRVRLLQLASILILLLYASLAHRTAVVNWRVNRDDRRIAENPHYTLLASTITELLGGRSPHLKETFPPDDVNDFLLVSQRPAGAPPTPNLPRGPRNVIVVVLESVSTQHMSLYGSPFKTTPNLDAEAANSLVFDNVYAHFTNTANAVAAMLLSIYPPMTWREYTVERPDLPGHTVAQSLKPLGYRTAFISGGDNQYANQLNFLKNRGFDTIWDCRDTGRPRDFSWGVEDRHTIDMILKWIDQDPAKPFYIFSWTQCTHNPYLLPAGQPEIDFYKQPAQTLPRAETGGWKLSRFLNALHETDRQLGRLMNALRQRNLADDTILLIIGDHGEAFGFPHGSWGHTGKIYQEDIHVPLIIWNPLLFKTARRADTVGAQVDLGPTILDLLNIPSPPTWQGHSLFSPTRPPRAYFYGAMDDFLIGLRERNHKYIYNATLGREELYDLTRDPNEQANLAAQQPDLCKRLRQRLAAWLDYQKRHAR